MSEKKSWDIQPRRRTPHAPAERPARTPAPAARPIRTTQQSASRPRPRTSFSTSKPVRIQKSAESKKHASVQAPRREKIPLGKEREPLKDRRRRARRRLRTILIALVAVIAIGSFICVWLPAFRIQHVEAAGIDSSEIQTQVSSSLYGTIDIVFPRDSIFFFPSSTIRSDILARHPDISAVSISATSFDTLSVQTIERDSALLWCGTTYDPHVPSSSLVSSSTIPSSATDSHASTSTPAILPSEGPVSPCYNADSQGFIFSVADASDPDQLANTLQVFDAISGSSSSPIGSQMAESSNIVNALSFVKAIESLGVPITRLVFRGDEADLYAQSGTRITYVLGQEQAAAQLAASAFPSLSLMTVRSNTSI